MKVLILNCGSSSLKCQLIDMDKEENQHPHQELESTEMIDPIIVPIS